jgi:hypothetical protein
MPHNFGEGIEPGMRFSPMKIVEGKCASKCCEVISAETLPDLSDATNSNHHYDESGSKQSIGLLR